MPFFDDVQNEIASTKAANGPAELGVAKSLRQTLLDARRCSGPYNLQKWASSLRLLRDKDGVAQSRIDAVLAWLPKAIADKYTPKVFDAESFRKKFTALEAAKEREDERGRDDTKIRDKTIDLINRMGLRWPDDTNTDEVYLTAELTRRAHRDMLDALLNLRDDDAEEEQKRRAAGGPYSTGDLHHLACKDLISRLGSWETFVTNWMADVHHIAHHWPEWRGQVRSFVFHRNHKTFLKMLEPWSREYGGRPQYFREIIDYAYQD